jgi:signal transduction histidine kinase
VLIRPIEFVVAFVRVAAAGIRRPAGLITLDLLRSDLSHEVAGKLARLAALLGEWRKGRYLATDCADALEILGEIEKGFLSYARFATPSVKSTIRTAKLIASVSATRARLRPARGGHPLSLADIERLQKDLARIKDRSAELVDDLCRHHGIRIADVVSVATDQIRREIGGGFGPGAVPVVLEDSGADRSSWVPKRDGLLWQDILRNLIRNAVEATQEKGRPDPKTDVDAFPSVVVRLSGRSIQGGTVIEIRDDGVGMTETEVEAIWSSGASRHGVERGRGLTEAKRAFLLDRARLDVRTAPGIGTSFRIEVPLLDIPLDPPPLVTLRPVTIPLALGLIILAGALATRHHPEAVTIEMSGGTVLSGLDSRRQVVWQRDLHESIRRNFISADWIHDEERAQLDNFLILRDDRGRAKGTVVSTQPPSGPGHLLFLDLHGDPKKIRTFAWVPPAGESLNKLMCWWETEVPWENPRGRALVAHVRDDRYSPSCTQFFGTDWESLGAYYHRGHLKFFAAQDLDSDGRIEILLFGINNFAPHDTTLYRHEPDVYIDCLVLLEAPRVSGQAYPYRDWPGMPHAGEEGYILLPVLMDKVRPEVRVINLGTKDASGNTPIEVILLDGRIYHFDSHLRPLSCAIGDFTAASKLDHPRPLAPFVYIHDGIRETIDVPIR